MSVGLKQHGRLGGRAKGTPNKKTQDIIDRLEAMGCDPLEGMARIALGLYQCPTCRGTKKQRYSISMAGPYVDTEHGTERDCIACNGTGFEPIPAKLSGDMFKELAQYVAPKRKAIELTDGQGAPLPVVYHVPDNGRLVQVPNPSAS